MVISFVLIQAHCKKSSEITMKKKIKLMTDYRCYPLWWYDSDKVGDIDPATLPLSEKTITRLNAYADAKNSSLNWDYPPDTPNPTEEEIEATEEEGLSLWQQLQKELAPDYEVVYFSVRLGKIVTHLSELSPSNRDLIALAS